MFLKIDQSQARNDRYTLELGALKGKEKDPSWAGTLKVTQPEESKKGKEVIEVNNSFQAIMRAYTGKYDGILLPYSDGQQIIDLAAVFRTYSLPCLLIVLLTDKDYGEVNDEKERLGKIITLLKAGVDYVALGQKWVQWFEEKMKEGVDNQAVSALRPA